MKEGETLDQLAGRISAMSIRYANLGGLLENAALVKKLLDSVPDRFIHCIAGMEQFCDLKTMAFEEAVGRLKAYDERTNRASGGGSVDGQLLLTRAEWEARQKKEAGESSGKGRSSDGGGRGRGGRGRGRGRGRGGRGESPTKGGSGGSGNKSRDKSHIQCFNCEKYGHYASECKAPKKESEAHLAKADDTEPALLLAETEEIGPARLGQQEAAYLSEDGVFPELQHMEHTVAAAEMWYLDNGASNHMTGDRLKFYELDEDVTGNVKFGDGSRVKIMGKGSILFACKNGEQWLLHEVYYIPSLCSNLVSLGQLAETGHRVVMDGNELEVFQKDPFRLIMKVKRAANRLYRIEL
ncbi:uncharacterized protein LOC133909721 [Phragmites australis]|uniref:uncharacterized protein LOC133909721 n=1 Tax=Phragmites australis TaxID=29695 RepID=UPI002D76A808|nr:uncharacterized protein LOC133909721 [Phragmites australis]